MPNCPRCGTNRQVWKNQLTGKLTCHRWGCHIEIEPLSVREQLRELGGQEMVRKPLKLLKAALAAGQKALSDHRNKLKRGRYV